MDRAVSRVIGPGGRRFFGPLKMRIGLVVGVLAILLGLTVALATRIANDIDELRGLAREAAAQAATADMMRDELSEAVSYERGFILTGQAHFIDQYRDAMRQVGAAQAALEKLGARTDWLRDEAARLRAAIKDRTASMDRAIALAQAGDKDAALGIVMNGTGDAIIDSGREMASRIVRRADAIREDRLEAMRVREEETAVGVVVASAIGLVLLGLAAVALLVGHARLTRSDRELRLQSERLAATIANLRDGVAVFDADDRLLIWNTNFFRATRLPTALAVRGCPFSRFAEAAAVWPGSPLALARPKQTPQAAQIAVDGRTVDLWRASMPDGGQMLAAIDASERVVAEESARQASKMEALGQLTGGVAHDFNNLLQVVTSNLEMVRPALQGEGEGADRSSSQKLAAAMAGVERAAQLTRHLLAFARRQPLAPATIDPRQMLAGLEDMLARTLGETIATELMIEPDIWPVRADPHLLENAILNLAINARDAMPLGGKLTIGATKVVLNSEAHGVAAGEYVRFTVSDTGHGMSPETLTRAVEPFFTTKPDGHGTGLGLPMVFGFARQSGGNFEIESAYGHGTTAALLIPRSIDTVKPTVPEAAEDRVWQPPASGEVVLAVEDDAAVRCAAIDALQSLGYRVVAAANASEALSLLEGGLRPDILFTDVVMPGQPSARVLAEEARRLDPGVAVLFTSGYTDKSIGLDCAAERLPDPSFPLLRKPWRIVDLDRELRAALLRARGNAGGANGSTTQPPHAAGTRAKRAMLVEDDAMVRMVTADLLIELGYEVTEFGTGQSALLALKCMPPDLLVTDLGLPDMDGLDVAREAVRIAPDLPVIIASGAQNSGQDGFIFLEKPYDATRLRGAVGKAVQAAA